MKMRANAMKLLTFYFLILQGNAQEVDGPEEVHREIKVCSFCTCSEIPDVDGTHLVLNILCSELDRIENLSDLDKIQWPENPNGLKISATFEGLGLTTLSKLPPNSQIESLRFINNAIKTYWPDPFSEVPSLKKLSFSQNELTEITPDLFTKIDSLEHLDLSYNKISDFNPLDFKFLRHLKTFNLQSNLLKRVPVEAMQPMTMLEDLDLSKNGIHDLLLSRHEIPTLTNVRRLYLNGNRIRAVVKDSFPQNNTIELLDLSNNVIEVIEDEAFLSCLNLKELNLAQNNITFLFAMPPSLQIAILKINTLYHWPRFPKTITFIDLSYNRLTSLYDEHNVDFDNLEILSIGGNQIIEFEIQKKLPKLYNLDISYNLIPEVPKCLNTQTFPNLEELVLDGNPIQSIYFKNIVALKNLYMNDLAKLSVLEDKAFSNVVGRHSDEATNVRKCFSLYLSNCANLSVIQDGAFDGTSLCLLDLSKNNLTSLSKDLLDWSSVTEGVNLQFNPWHCGCELQWVLDELLPQMYQVNSRLLTELRCGSPRVYSGLRLVHWYNWTERALCGESHRNFSLEPSTESPWAVSWLTLILGGCIILSLLVAISLAVYLVRSRRRQRARRAAMRRKRQSAADARHSTDKEQFSALNKA